MFLIFDESKRGRYFPVALITEMQCVQNASGLLGVEFELSKLSLLYI